MSFAELQALLSGAGIVAEASREMFFWWLIYKCVESLALVIALLSLISAGIHIIKWLNPRTQDVSPLLAATDAVRKLWYSSRSGTRSTTYYEMFKQLENDLEREGDK